jgi:hypothetical protein
MGGSTSVAFEIAAKGRSISCGSICRLPRIGCILVIYGRATPSSVAGKRGNQRFVVWTIKLSPPRRSGSRAERPADSNDAAAPYDLRVWHPETNEPPFDSKKPPSRPVVFVGLQSPQRSEVDRDR